MEGSGINLVPKMFPFPMGNGPIAVHRDVSRAIGGLVRDKEHSCVQAFYFSGHGSTACQGQ